MRSATMGKRESANRQLGVALAAVKQQLAYRFDFFMSLLFSLTMMALLYYLWTAIYRSSQNLTLPFASAITYVCLGQAFNFTRLAGNRQIERVSQAIRTGDVAIELVRPGDFQARLLSEYGAIFLVETLLISIPAYGLARLVFGIDAPISQAAALWFVASLLGAFLLSFALNFLVTVLGFWTTSTFGLIYARQAVVDILAGAIIPFAFFPPWLRGIALALPFRGIAYTPFSIYTGTITGPDVWLHVVSQFAWAAALILATRLLWTRALRHLEVQGG